MHKQTNWKWYDKPSHDRFEFVCEWTTKPEFAKPLHTAPTLFVSYKHRGWNLSGLVALSPDGTKLLASEEGIVRLWDAATRQMLRDVAPEDNHNFVTFLRDGKRAAVGDLFGQIGIWEIASGNCVGQYKASTEVVRCISTSDDGRLILACYSGHCDQKADGSLGGIGGSKSGDTAVAFWNIQSQQQLQRLDSRGGHVQSAGFIPQTHHVVWGSDKGDLGIWDVDTAKQLSEIEGGLPQVRHLSVSADGRIVAAAMGGSGDGRDWIVGIWDLETRKRLRFIEAVPREAHDPTMRFVFLSPDGSRVLSLAEGDGARLWDVATGAEIANTNSKDRYYHAAFFPDGRSAILAPPSGDIFKWQLPPPTPGKSAANKPSASDHEREVAEWVLSKGGKVAIEGNDALISTAAAMPAGPIRLKDIDFEEAAIVDADLTRLQHLPNLQMLRLPSTAIGDTGLAKLFDLPQLSNLNLQATKVTSAGVASLRRHPRLSILYLSGQAVDDKFLDEICTLPRLSFLDIANVELTSAGMQHLQKLKSLQVLNINSPAMGDEELQYLQGLPIHTLRLWNTSVTGKGLTYLASLSRLGELWLYKLTVDDSDLAELERLPLLHKLVISGTPITDAGCEHLKRCKNLKELDLTDTRLTQQGLDILRAALPNCKINSSLPATNKSSQSPSPPAAAKNHEREVAEWVLPMGGRYS